MYRARIIGTGFYVPPKVVTNHDLEQMFDTNDEWIRQRTGIRERRYIDEGMTGAEMSASAARAACENAGIEVGEIDFLFHATLSPDHVMPGTGVITGGLLGLNGVPAMDVRNQCSGFLYSLTTAKALIEVGMYKTILVTGCEIHSTGLEFSDRGRDVTVLFGDGAGSVIVTREDRGEGWGILKSIIHADGKYYKELWVECDGSRHHPRITPEMIEDGRIYPRMKGRRVFVHAVKRQPEVMRRVLEEAGYGVRDVDAYIFHQANLRIIEAVGAELGIPDPRIFNNIDKYGNTTAASIPIALHEAREAGLIKEGSLVMLTAFGAGFTWGAILIKW